MNGRNLRVLATFIILLFLTIVNCSLTGGLSSTGSSLIKPQSGEWKASLLLKTPGYSDMHWVFGFSVSDDGKQITQARLERYSGNLAPDTRISISEIMSMPVNITNNSISLSFTVVEGYSMSTYEFKGIFTSSMEAKGTVKIDKTAYSWTATPATANGTPLPTEVSATETETLQRASETLQPTATPTSLPLAGLKAIAAGYRHTCALTSSGGVKCWGINQFGQLGDGTRTDSMIPVDVRGLSGEVAAIAMGSDHTCVLMSSGGVKCWGSDEDGELGQGTIELADGSRMDSVIPVDVIGLSSGVAAIAAGNDHTCALTPSGGVKCWGDNGSGELGNGTTTLSNIPVDVTGLSSGIIAIAAGSNYTCALTSSGEVKCWGQNDYGQLGDGTTTNSGIPVDVIGLKNGIVAITAGGSHSCALTSSGEVKCWGWNSNGQLGNQSDTDSSVPVNIIGFSSGVISLSAGDMHTCALTSDGGVKCWGYNHFGQLGDGTTTASNVPVDVNGLSGQVLAISLGSSYTCALIAGGGVKCWGENEFGKLGDGTTTNSSVPVDVIM